MPLLEISGTRSYYNTFGQGDPILFPRGLVSRRRNWEYLIDQGIKMDVRGHRHSDKSPKLVSRTLRKRLLFYQRPHRSVIGKGEVLSKRLFIKPE